LPDPPEAVASQGASYTPARQVGRGVRGGSTPAGQRCRCRPTYLRLPARGGWARRHKKRLPTPT